MQRQAFMSVASSDTATHTIGPHCGLRYLSSHTNAQPSHPSWALISISIKISS